MDKLVEHAFYGMCKRVDSPVSLALWLMYKHAPLEYACHELQPGHYTSAVSFFRDYACQSLLRKYELLATGVDLEGEAISRFDKAEDRCALTNADILAHANWRGLPSSGFAILHRIQKHIACVWGQPRFEHLFRRCDWGPGATATLKGRNASVESKMSELPLSVSPLALPFLRQVLRDDIAWNRHLLGEDVCGPVSLLPDCFALKSDSRLLTVPKDAKTDRTIAAEPSANIFLQKGVGRYLRDRLKRFGVDLDDQTRNQSLAQQAYTAKLATLDLSSASDTIAAQICRLLLPADMYAVLESLRTPCYSYKGSVRRFSKFSSMGNGFTFELESLIFWAVAKAVQEEAQVSAPIGVYGDDIIVHSDLYSRVVSVLSELGFTVNASKSFCSGPFYESCGEHFFTGLRVTPVFQKHAVDHDLERLRFVNRLRSLVLTEYELCSESVFEAVWRQAFDSLPPSLRRLTAPDWVEGDGFLRTADHSGRFSYNHGYLIRYLRPKPPARVRNGGGSLALALRKSSNDEFTDWQGFCDLRPRGRVTKYTLCKRWVGLHLRTATR